MQMPFVKACCCWPFLLIKEWLRNLSSRFLVRRGQGLFVKRTETFCQGFLPVGKFFLSKNRNLLSRFLVRRPILFVKEWLRNLLSRFLAAGASSFCQRASPPFVKVSLGWLFCQGLCSAFKTHIGLRRHPLQHPGLPTHVPFGKGLLLTRLYPFGKELPFDKDPFGKGFPFGKDVRILLSRMLWPSELQRKLLSNLSKLPQLKHSCNRETCDFAAANQYKNQKGNQ
ncbi:MAG: hypothetical protein OIF58_14965, partial [Cohaesibacter sp.]|nr:hypothetical protein [Cohaesibacter sp.]